MILPALNRTVLRSALAQIAQLDGAYDSKTGQSGQIGQHIENAQELGAISGQKPHSYAPELANESVRRWMHDACDVSNPIGAAHAHRYGARSP
jgi:hypothetical protein